MTVQITRAQLAKSGIADLDAAIAAYVKAREDHALTVDVPAPTAHPYVEQIVRGGGTYEIVEEAPDTGEPLSSTWVQQLEKRVAALEAAIKESVRI